LSRWSVRVTKDGDAPINKREASQLGAAASQHLPVAAVVLAVQPGADGHQAHVLVVRTRRRWERRRMPARLPAAA
jgi:hypothetical protein